MHHHIFVIFVAIVTLPRCHSFFGFGKVQSVAADGKLWCNGHPAANVKVKLFDAGIREFCAIDPWRGATSNMSAHKFECSALRSRKLLVLKLGNGGKHLQTGCEGVSASQHSLIMQRTITLFAVFDTKLAESRSDPKGRFYLAGWKREVSSIDPKLNIYHKCNRVAKCYRKFSIRIPASYIAKGKKPMKVFHLGVTDLSKKQPGETIDCVN
ncbi:Transthyretin-like family protein [Ostertagia ostertagi]